MSDNRHWAKIDTSYIMNPKWFRVERFIGDHIELANGKTDGTCHQLAIANALRTARESHLASILYCSQNQTDGVFPVRAIKAVASVVTSDEETALTALFEVGLWINLPGGMAEVHDYLEHQTPASLTKKRSDAGKKGAAARWQNDDKSAQSANGKTMASANAEEKRREEKRSNTPYKSPTGDDAPKSKRKPAAKYSPDFEAFWEAFPKDRKVGKTKCWGKFEAAIESGVDPQAIIEAAERYRDDPNREPQFTTMPETWLNQERWEAGPLPPRGGQQSRSQQAWEADMRQILAEEQGGQLQIGGSL